MTVHKTSLAPTGHTSVFGLVGIGASFCIWMAVFAVGLAEIMAGDVGLVCNGFKMVGINASLVPASVIKFFSFRNWAYEHFEGNTISESVVIPSPEPPVAALVFLSNPIPATAIWIKVNLFNESFEDWPVFAHTNEATQLPWVIPAHDKPTTEDGLKLGSSRIGLESLSSPTLSPPP